MTSGTVVDATVSLVVIALIAIPLGINQFLDVELHEDAGSAVEVIKENIPALVMVVFVIAFIRMLSR